MSSLSILDLFSGIGGFSYALQSIGTTVAYCEIDTYCRKVLSKNIDKGKLTPAPIYSDVAKISKQDLEHLNPNMITAGFPCQDISSANPNGEGLNGAKSGLFKHILRIIDLHNNIQTVFLENSPRILSKGFTFIKSQMIKRGFKVKFCITEAKYVGALHKRKRWYCLCYKQNPNITIPTNNIHFPWRSAAKIKTMVKILSPKQKACIYRRCSQLGNSIVPQCAMHAWNALVSSNSNQSQINITPYKISDPLNITFSDGQKSFTRKYWATPTYAVWFQVKSLSKRSSTILSNQLFYDVNNHISDKNSVSNHYIANPVFIETLMGYPKHWTRQ